MKILIVEDQENLARLIKRGLEAEGISADYVLNGEEGQKRLSLYHDDYNLVILDIMLPKKNGLEICRELREKGIALPVIMLTAKDGANDIVAGLNTGADDYIVKPFSFEILLARIRAILRRPPDKIIKELQAKNVVLNPLTKEVRRDQEKINLTLKEFSILEYLMRNPGVVLTRDQILANAWDFAFDSFANVVDVHITNVRKKIGDTGGEIIETIRGVGYKINS